MTPTKLPNSWLTTAARSSTTSGNLPGQKGNQPALGRDPPAADLARWQFALAQEMVGRAPIALDGSGDPIDLPDQIAFLVSRLRHGLLSVASGNNLLRVDPAQYGCINAVLRSFEGLAVGERGPAVGSGRKGDPTAIRFAPELKRRLRAAATAAGHSLSREVEERLERSFAEDAILSDGDSTWLLWGMQIVINYVVADTGQPWHSDGFTRDVIAENLKAFMEMQGPRTKAAPPPKSFPAWMPDLPPSLAEERRRTVEMMMQGIGRRYAYQADHNMKGDLLELGSGEAADFARARLAKSLANERRIGRQLSKRQKQENGQ
jgi:hypothetical protein